MIFRIQTLYNIIDYNDFEEANKASKSMIKRIREKQLMADDGLTQIGKWGDFGIKFFPEYEYMKQTTII